MNPTNPADLYTAVAALIDNREDGWWDVDLTSDGALVITSGERQAYTRPATTDADARGLAALWDIIDAVGTIAALVGRYGIDHRAVDGYSRLHHEFVSGLDLLGGRGLGEHHYEPVSVGALYEATHLIAEGARADLACVTRWPGVPMPHALDDVAATSHVVYDLVALYHAAAADAGEPVHIVGI